MHISDEPRLGDAAPRTRTRRWPKRVALAAAVVLALAAAGYAYYGYAPAPKLPGLSSAAASGSVDVDGRPRSYLSYVPDGLPPGAPLLIMFHGSLQDGAAIRAGTAYELDVLADRHRFAVVYPDGYDGGWNDCRRTAATRARIENVDDEGFVRHLVDRFRDQHGIDAGRVFVAGYSNGGHMAFRLAANTPDRIAGFAAIGASLPEPANNDCASGRGPVPALLMTGTADPISPHDGGEVSLFGFQSRGRVLSADETARFFVQVNGIQSAAASRTLPRREGSGDTEVVVDEYRDHGKAPVTQYTIVNGGHVVPNNSYRYMRILGPTTRDFSAAEVMWEFFRSTARG